MKWDFHQVDGGWHIRNASNGAYLTFEGNAQNGVKVIGTNQAHTWHIWPDSKDNSSYR